MRALMRRRSRPAQRTLLLLGEAAQLGPSDGLRAAVTLLRGYGVQTWSFWQDMSQLQNLYPQDWKTIVNNCHVIRSFGCGSALLARDVADLHGLPHSQVLSWTGTRWCSRSPAMRPWSPSAPTTSRTPASPRRRSRGWPPASPSAGMSGVREASRTQPRAHRAACRPRGAPTPSALGGRR